MGSNGYVIISPVRNEAAYIEKTIRSVAVQTVKPLEWIIVNDGSKDETANLIKKYMPECPWIRLVEKEDRGFTQVGKGVIEVFNRGYENISRNNWDFIVKLDCDLSFTEGYFEKLINEFAVDGVLGICGGTSFAVENGTRVEEKMPIFHPCAAARIYSRKCFEEIGGLIEALGWDTIDLLRAQMRGWTTKRIPHLELSHYRRMSSRNGLWEGKLRTGRNFFITGYHPLFLVARSIYRLKEKPYLIESLGVMAGYLKAMLKGESLVVSMEERAFLRRQQMRRLVGFNRTV